MSKTNTSDSNRRGKPYVRVRADKNGVHVEAGEEQTRSAKECFESASRTLDEHFKEAAKHVSNAFVKLQASFDGSATPPPPPPSQSPPSAQSEAFSSLYPKSKEAQKAEKQAAREQAKREASKQEDETYDAGDLIWTIIAITLLGPLMLLIALLMAIGPFVSFLVQFISAIASSVIGAANVCKHGGTVKARKQVGRDVGREWRETGRALMETIYQFSRPFGLGGLLRNVQRRVDEINTRYESYLNQKSDAEHTPDAFRSRYHVVDQLPSGGSGARLYVVRKVDGNPGELFVLKNFDVQGGVLENLIRENQAVELGKRLGLVVDSQVDEASFYYVMPFYRGRTLTNRVLDQYRGSDDVRVDWNEYGWRSLGWVHQLLQVIAQFHEAGIFHKDIKPDNLICEGDRIHLVDIGLLTPLESVQQLTTHGTEYFRDPEMVRQAMNGAAVRDVNAAKFDIYAIGAVLYFLFEGELPTSGSLSRMNRNVPRAVRMVIQRAMAPFDQRYSSARQMLADIDQLSFAASQDRLMDVRPADLPSFRASTERDPIDMPATDAATMPPPNYAASPWATDRHYGPTWGLPEYAARHPRGYVAPKKEGSGFFRKAFNGLLWVLVLFFLGVSFVKFVAPYLEKHTDIALDEATPEDVRIDDAGDPAFSSGPAHRNSGASKQSQALSGTPLERLYQAAEVTPAKIHFGISQFEASQRITATNAIAEDLQAALESASKQIGQEQIQLVVIGSSDDSPKGNLTRDVKSALASYGLPWVSDYQIEELQGVHTELVDRSQYLRWLNMLEAYSTYLERANDAQKEPRALPMIVIVESGAKVSVLYPGVVLEWRLN